MIVDEVSATVQIASYTIIKMQNDFLVMRCRCEAGFHFFTAPNSATQLEKQYCKYIGFLELLAVVLLYFL